MARENKIKELRQRTVGVIAPDFPDQKYIQDRYLTFTTSSDKEAIEQYFEHREIKHWLRSDEKHLVGIVATAPVAERWLIPVPISIDAEFIDDIMCTALEGGITYWCDECKTIKQAGVKVEHASDAISKGGVLSLHLAEGPIDDEDKEWYELDLPKFLRGLQMFWVSQSENAGGMMDVDAGNFDADLADTVIQYAVFGEVVFG